jgi:hypothetical protein
MYLNTCMLRTSTAPFLNGVTREYSWVHVSLTRAFSAAAHTPQHGMHSTTIDVGRLHGLSYV